jgi:hypothetical protein
MDERIRVAAEFGGEVRAVDSRDLWLVTLLTSCSLAVPHCRSSGLLRRNRSRQLVARRRLARRFR